MKKSFTSSLVSFASSGKKVIFCLFLFLIFVSYLSVLTLAEIEQCEEGDDSCKIDNGYSCLQEKIDTRTCARLGFEEKVFSLIATGDCKSEVISDTKYKSDIKYTALALFGGASTNATESWLVSKNRTTSDLDWFLQIDTSESGELTCDITKGTSISTVVFNEDKTIKTLGSGSCFSSTSTGDYWLEIEPTCFSQDLKISCDKTFTTNLLYAKQGSTNPIYVSDETNPASAEGETTERVDSLCFGTTGTTGNCNYEGTLWAALVLNSLNYDVSPYIPYLVTNIDTGTNSAFLPESFLYLLTGDFGNELLGKQKADKWFCGDSACSKKFYDTSLALYAFQYDDSLQKQNSVSWLLNEAQGTDGCWNNGNIRDTAFVLYALEPRSSFGGDVIDEANDCEDAGNYCMSSRSCSEAGGNILDSFSCSGTFVCCDEQRVLETCAEQEGEICSSNQNCIGGDVAQASDLSSGEICCISGRCEIPSSTGEEESECVSAGGECRLNNCLESEEESFESCEFGTEICCMEKQATKTLSSFWIWTLLILIVLSIFGIIFRNKLSHLWFRFRHGFSGSASMHHPGGRPPFSPSMIPQRIFSPRPAHHPQPSNVPPTHHPQQEHHKQQSSSELSDVLKKLKDMGK